MNFLIFSFLFSIPIAMWIFNPYKTNHIPITKYFFIHCLFLIFATIFVINYHINYLGIISYISSSCFVLFCVCNDMFTSEEKNLIYKKIRKLSFFKMNNINDIIIIKLLQIMMDVLSLLLIIRLSNLESFSKRKRFIKIFVINFLISAISFFNFYNDININSIFTIICFCLSSIIIIINFMKSICLEGYSSF